MDPAFAAAWKAAVARRFPDDRRDALDKLSGRRDELPGALFVGLTVTELNDERWAAIVAATEPQCACGARRLMVPTRGRSRFVPGKPPSVVALTATNPVYLAPWGGDLESVFLGLRLDGNKLVVRQQPFGVQPQYPNELPPLLNTRGRRPNERAFGLSDMAVAIGMHGDNICMQPIAGITVPVCSVVKIDLAGYMVHVEIDAYTTHIPSFEAAPAHHVCPQA